MKNYCRRGVHLLLALALSLPLTACGGSGGSTSEPTEPPKEMKEDVREELKSLAAETPLLTGELENKTIKWLSDWDINANEGKTTPTDVAVFQERYGGVIEFHQTTYGARYDNLANAINSDEGIDFFYGGNWDAFPKGAIRGMFVPFDDYIDLDSELWAEVKAANDSMIWNGDHYMAIADVTGDNCAIIYNRKTIDENNLDDPAELLEKGEWTWDAFEDMLKAFVDTDNEHYGIDSWWFESGLSASTGVPYIGIDNGKLVNNLRNEAIEDYQNWMYGLYQSGYIAIGVGDYGWTSRPEYIGEGKLLFYPCGLWTLGTPKEQWAKTFGEDVFFVPVPRYEKADAHYTPTSVNAYCFVKGGHNLEGVGKYLDCFRFAKTNESAQKLGEQQEREDYGWSDEMIEMANQMDEMALEHPMFDYYNGISTDVSAVLDSSEHGIRASSRGTPWNESVNAIYDQVQNYLDEINEAS